MSEVQSTSEEVQLVPCICESSEQNNVDEVPSDNCASTEQNKVNEVPSEDFINAAEPVTQVTEPAHQTAEPVPQVEHSVTQVAELALQVANPAPLVGGPVLQEEPAPQLVESDPYVIEPVSQVAEPAKTIEVNDDSQKRKEPIENETTEQSNSKTSRELKSILALSKEAKLDTNISHKRKTLENVKDKDSVSKPATGETENLQPPTRRTPKFTPETRKIRYPVTAECELENSYISFEDIKQVHKDTPTKGFKRIKDFEGPAGGATDEVHKRSRKIHVTEVTMFKQNKDMFCWRCHRDEVNIVCETCPRAYHQKCLKQVINDPDHWPCPECVSILKAENTLTRSDAMKGMTLEHLCDLLKFAVKRMMQCTGSEPFIHPVNEKHFPDYKKYIIQPMDLTLMERNIKNNLYGSTQAFEADAKWILHNSIIFNSYQSKLTSVAKGIVKICKQEMAEIENCPTCYMNANTRMKTWFVEVCPKPHLLVWAKLKGFPFWPAKVMTTNSAGMVDVRFFGAHDRAWVPAKECYLYSEKDPNSFKQKRYDIDQCVKELKTHVDNLRKTYGEVHFAPFKEPYDPDNESKQLQKMLPQYRSFSRTKSNKYSKRLGTESKPEKRESLKNIYKEKGVPMTKNAIYNSKTDDLDSTMEGYGTDDDTMPEISNERRKMLLGETKSEPPGTEKAEDEEEDDTQVPNKMLDGTLKRGNVRTRGGLSNFSGGLKTIPKQIENSQKRRSADSLHDVNEKILRRNSDQSDCKISNHFDKISKVNIEEDIELSLGNDDSGCVSISENVSTSASESSKVDDGIVEIKKKPVQVDIENSEYSISPQSKLRISDKLIRKLSDAESSKENVARRLSPEKSQTDRLLEKYKDIVEHMVVDFADTPESAESKETTCSKGAVRNEENLKQSQPIDNTENINKEKTVTNNLKEKVIETPTASGTANDKSVIISMDFTQKTVKDLSKQLIFENDATATNNLVACKNGTSALLDSCIDENDLVTIRRVSIEEVSSVEPTKVSLQKSGMKNDNENRRNSTESIDDIFIEHEDIGDQDEKPPEIVENNLHYNDNDNLQESVENTKDQKAEKHQTNSSGVSSTKSIDVMVKPKKLLQQSIRDFTKDTSTRISKDSTGKSTEKNSAPVLSTEVMDIIQEFEESEENESLDSLQIDEMNIRNIIHSSLNTVNLKDQNKTDTTNKVNGLDKSSDESKSSSLRSSPTIKKRKLITDKNEKSTSQSKLIKLISIESILRSDDNNSIDSIKQPVSRDMSVLKKDRDKTPTGDNTGTNIQKPLTSSQASNIASADSPSEDSVMQDISSVEIKSEPESDGDGSDSDYMEAKRKYLSALNISEKQDQLDKNKPNEIRTRAKAEEKVNKFRVIDNLTRVIDDVALNYSAINEGKELPAKKERRKSFACLPPRDEIGEIFVKSFAKFPVLVPTKQKARKTFPTPNYTKPPTITKTIPKPANIEKPMHPANTPLRVVATNIMPPPLQKSTVTQLDPRNTAGGLVILTQQPTQVLTQQPTQDLVVLPPNQTITYNSSVTVANPVLTVMPPPIATTTTLSVPVPSNTVTQTTNTAIRAIGPLAAESQNYIPQNEIVTHAPSTASSSSTSNILLNSLLNERSAPDRPPVQNSELERTNIVEPTIANQPETNEFGILNGLIPENLSKAVSELLCRPPPKLKSRPPGPLSSVYDEGTPSSAGPVTTKINSVAHRLGDYFRGMLIETLEDLGKTDNAESTISSLKLEIESIKHKHEVELVEIKKNICTILKDIQKCIVEEKEKLIDETRAACELETIRRVEEAKSKQWCANCFKEAQFYCCWNTSYCDYPCQQRHWPKHMNKCTQNLNQNASPATAKPPSQQLLLRPANPPKPGFGRIYAKPAKLYMNRSGGTPKSISTFKTSTGSHLTLVESTPGNFELLGNGPIAVSGKILATTSVMSKFRTTNITVSSPSTSGSPSQISSHKVTTVTQSKSPAVTSRPVTTISDEESD